MRAVCRVAAAVVVVLAVGVAGCGRGEAGLSDQQVRDVVREELAVFGEDLVSREQLGRAVADAVAVSRSEPSAGGVSLVSAEPVSPDEAAAASPSKLEPAGYTKHVVAEAIDLYEREGLDAVVDYHNRVENVDDQWYVFVVDESSQIISHFEPDRRGARLDSWVGVDANGYQFGLEMLEATSEGAWVTYVYRNPDTADLNAGEIGDLQLKNAWAVRHDGLLFVSGWYVDADELIPSLVSQSAELFLDSPDLAAYLERLTSAETITAATASTVAYYNSSGHEGQWIGFIADSDGELISAPSNPELEGLDLVDVVGSGALGVDANGAWITEADNDPGTGPAALRVWVMSLDGYYFGAGWVQPQS